MTPITAIKEELIALNNSGDLESLRKAILKLPEADNKEMTCDILIFFTCHKNSMIQRNAVIALGELRDPKASRAVAHVMRREIDTAKLVEKRGRQISVVNEVLIKECSSALRKIQDPGCVEEIKRYTDRLEYYGKLSDELIKHIHETITIIESNNQRLSS